MIPSFKMLNFFNALPLLKRKSIFVTNLFVFIFNKQKK